MFVYLYALDQDGIDPGITAISPTVSYGDMRQASSLPTIVTRREIKGRENPRRNILRMESCTGNQFVRRLRQLPREGLAQISEGLFELWYDDLG